MDARTEELRCMAMPKVMKSHPWKILQLQPEEQSSELTRQALRQQWLAILPTAEQRLSALSDA